MTRAIKAAAAAGVMACASFLFVPQATMAGGAQAISGTASWYGSKFHGRSTANGERFNMNGKTAAHRSLPFGTEVRVTNRHNGRTVTVRINDRGPFAGNRVIDLSKGAAQSIGMINSGTAPVTVEVTGRGGA